MKFNSKYLLSPWFIISLVVLLCNDTWWKYQFSNVLTGKLSDLSGVLVLGLLFNFFSDKNRTLNALFVVVFFTFWKSPLSEGLIFSWNSLHLFPIARVVDYSDLMAFALLPVVSHLRFKEYSFVARPMVSGLLLGISIFALTATSRARPMDWEYWNYGPSTKIVCSETKLTKEQLTQKFESQLGLKLSMEDTVWINGVQNKMYCFTSQNIPNQIIDSCLLTIDTWKKNKRSVQILSIKLLDGANALELAELDKLKEAFELKNIRIEKRNVSFENPQRIKDETQP